MKFALRSEKNEKQSRAARKQIHVDLNCDEGEALKMISELTGLSFRSLVIQSIRNMILKNSSVTVNNMDLEFEEKPLSVLTEELKALLAGEKSEQQDAEEETEKTVETKVVEAEKTPVNAMQDRFQDIMKELNSVETPAAEPVATQPEQTLKVEEVKKPALRTAKKAGKNKGPSVMSL